MKMQANPTSEGTVSNRIDPAFVPQRTLSTGARMPAIGLGTFGSDHVSASQIAEAVKAAARIGYRHFDCASVYGNEAQIGGAFPMSSHRASSAKSCGSLPRSGTTSTRPRM